MARVVRRRRIAAPASALWDVITDPYHLPRWWPNTQRVENVSEGAPDQRSWTQVLGTRGGRGVRADFRCIDSSAGERYVFEQTVEGTPFERFVRIARTEIELDALLATRIDLCLAIGGSSKTTPAAASLHATAVTLLSLRAGWPW